MSLHAPTAIFSTVGLLFLGLSPWAFGWETINHQTIADYAALKAASLTTPVSFSTTQRSLLQQGALDEDSGIRPLNHAYNPITDSGFPTGGTARNEIATRWTSMTGAFSAGNYNGGDGAGAWHYLGRVSHLMQDMGSPLHTFAIQHASPSCQYETYWGNNDSTLRSIVTSIGGPLQSSTLDAKATEKLDSFTTTRLQDRFNNSSPNKNSDDARGWVEVMAWSSYFRATFWGQVTMGNSACCSQVNGTATSSSTTSTTFSDGTVSSQVNVLHTMFGNGNVRWINNFIGDDYYEITDRNGYVFRWMSGTDIDDWSSCGRFWANGQRDTSARVGGSDDDSDGVRVTGRFWFDLRELGKSTSGTVNRYCYPPFYPDGSSMTEHLHQYLGNYNGPLAVRYNAGLLGLANRRVTVKTADSTQANGFAFGRADNFGNGASFNAASAGSNFFFVAKSSVSLTAPASNSGGRAFVRWLRDGSTFSGNTSRTITINDSSLWIPTGGVTYTAEYQTAISVTVQTSPSGRSFTVDGTTYTSSQTFSWTPGSSHPIATTSPQSGGTGIQHIWSSWSDGGAMSHSVALTSGTTYTANFATQNYLTMSAGTGGTVSPSSGWYNSGASVSISATANSGYAFSGWAGSGSGSYSGSSSSSSVTMNGPITETASFTATTRIISLSGNLAFGDVAVGSSSQRTLTIANNGNSTLTVTSISYPSGFSGNWSGTIPAGNSQNVTVTFSPTSATGYSGNLTVNSDATSGTNTRSVSGTGTTTPTRIISLSGNLAFGNVTVGSSSQSTLTIANNGNSTLTVNSISYPSGFSGNWSGTISAGNSQNVTVTFSPASAIGYSGNATVNSDATSGSGSIAVSGTGVSTPTTRVISLSGNLAFGYVAVGSSAQSTLAIANNGNATLTVNSISYPSGFSGNWSGTIPSSGSQNVTVTFSPTSTNVYSGNLTVSSDATSGSGSMGVSGTGGSAPSPTLPYEAKLAKALNTFSSRVTAPAGDGGFVVFGDFIGTITVGGQSLTASGTDRDIYGVRFDAAGQVVWVRQYGGVNEEQVSDCVKHPAGGWAISGYFKLDASLGSTSLTSAGNRDAFLARVAENGDILWSRRGGGSKVDYGQNVAVDGSGNCFLIGEFTTSATFSGGATTLTAVGTRFDIFVAKYNSNGDFQWAKSGGGTAYDTVACATADAAGNVYVGGTFETNAAFGPYSFTVQGNQLSYDGYLVKLNSAGDFVWAKRFGEGSGEDSSDYINFVTVSSNGTCFFGGSYNGPMNLESQSLPHQNSQTAFLGKINSAGNLEWLRALPVLSSFASYSDLYQGFASADGGVFIGGRFRGVMSFGGTSITNGSALMGMEDNLFLGKIDSLGSPLWPLSGFSTNYGYVVRLDETATGNLRMLSRFSVSPIIFSPLPPLTVAADEVVLSEFGPFQPPPTLGFSRIGNNIILTWPTSVTGFTLETGTNLPPTSWTSNSILPTIVSGQYTVTNPISGGAKFFRLKK